MAHKVVSRSRLRSSKRSPEEMWSSGTGTLRLIVNKHQGAHIESAPKAAYHFEIVTSITTGKTGAVALL